MRRTEVWSDLCCHLENVTPSREILSTQWAINIILNPQTNPVEMVCAVRSNIDIESMEIIFIELLNSAPYAGMSKN